MTDRKLHKIHIIDSHTGGEPTRVVVAGGPDLGQGSLFERRELFRSEYDRFRSAIVNEPRGSDIIVGALLVEPVDPSCAAGVIFFNNVGFIGMCGHGTIGVITTLAYLNRIGPGEYRIETPVGVVTARLDPSGSVSVENVPSFRFKKAVTVPVEGDGEVTGDIAWGGNWFFLVEDHHRELSLDHVESLTDYAWRVREALARHGLTGTDGAVIDHVEISGPAQNHDADSRNFVLCPGKAYDRSPCGTGASAKLACLLADGKIREGEIWRQESITGSMFEGTVRSEGGHTIPTITGRAFITAETTLLLDPADPWCWGIRKRVSGIRP